ncbi:hypothetical protein CDD82_6604 [Ophiocordyceps australis]|uniref:Uncharacterized protein n=1 Tax=Ophiocordyceps australis TaxID=1399860 RepID=A0A2C5XG79_9HYPO|nr:hypothetical protein CDD82_6604 [Ophiocordyceps australis]
MASKFKVLVLDLGGVLINWDARNVKNLSSRQLTNIMNTTAWHSLERGSLTLVDACKEFSKVLGVAESLVSRTLEQLQHTVTVNTALVQTIKHLKTLNPHLKLYIMSNISREHFCMVQRLNLAWAMFDALFISGHEGMRKPELCFFKHLVRHAQVDPREIVMLDDRVENVCAASSLGIHGVLVGGEGEASAVLRSMFEDPVARAEAFLRENAQRLDSVVDWLEERVVVRDNFSQLMILELTGDESLVYLRGPTDGEDDNGNTNDQVDDDGNTNDQVDNDGNTNDQVNDNGNTNGDTNDQINANNNDYTNSSVKHLLWNYLFQESHLVTPNFPCDADTTSIAFLSLPANHLPTPPQLQLVMDAMAANLDSDGIMQVYFSPDRPRTSPIVCCNMLRLFHRFGHASDPRIQKTQAWLIQCLQNNALRHGTRYYSTPDACLYFLALLWRESTSCYLRAKLRLVRPCLEQRVGVCTNPLALAMRLYACQVVGVREALYERDFRGLVALQHEDGGWPAGHYTRVGKTGACIGNRGLTTALALKVIQREKEKQAMGKQSCIAT